MSDIEIEKPNLKLVIIKLELALWTKGHGFGHGLLQSFKFLMSFVSI